MNITETVAACETGLVELDRLSWLAYLLKVKAADAEQRQWQIDLLIGSKNAPSERVFVERSKARAMCGLPPLASLPVAPTDEITRLVEAIQASIDADIAEQTAAVTAFIAEESKE